MTDWEDKLIRQNFEKKSRLGRRKGSTPIPKKIKVLVQKEVAQGKTQEEVAKKYGLSARTVQSYVKRMMTRLRKESELAVKQGLESVRTVTHENVVAAANIVNAHLKALEKEIATNPDAALEIGSTAAKDYAMIAAKEYDKLKSIDSGHSNASTGERHTTQVNILQLQESLKEVDIVNAESVFDVTPEQIGDSTNE